MAVELPPGTTKARKWELEQDMGSAAWAVVVPARNAKDRKAPAALLRVIIVVVARSVCGDGGVWCMRVNGQDKGGQGQEQRRV